MILSNRSHCLQLIRILALGGIISSTCTAAKIDLNRNEPVPASEQVPIMDFFRPAILQAPKLNLAGTHIASIISANEDHTQLMVYDLKSKKIEAVAYKGDKDIYQVDWLNDERVIYSVGVDKVFDGGLFAADVGALYSAYPILPAVWSTLVSVPPDDRTHPLVKVPANTRRTGKYGEVFRINTEVRSGETAKQIMNSYPVLKTDHGFDVWYQADKEGHLAFGCTSEDGVLTLHQLVGETWEKCPVNLEEVNFFGCGDNPGEIIVLGPRQDGKPRALEVMEAATGKVLDVLVQDKAYDCDPWLYRDPVTHNIMGAIYNRDGPRVTWFTEDYRSLQKVVDGLFPRQVVRILGTDKAGKVVLISTFSDRQPAIYSWVDLEKHQAGLIKNSSPWIDPERMQPMSIVKFKTRDGRQLDAYVTMPKGASKQNPPPLVVLPNPDPSMRYTWGFNAEAQFFASRGYAVLQPNCRASNGYTWMFPTEDEWAFRKMHDDVTDAAKTLIASGLIDPKRVAIIGTSFGGYLALSGAAYEPTLYQCAVSISGVYDWANLIADYKYSQHSNPYFSRMRFKLGDPKKDPEKWDAIAPLRHANQVRIPVLQSTSEYDAPIDIIESKKFAAILESNHIPVESMSFFNEFDGVSHLDHRIGLYTRIEAFLAKYLPAGDPTSKTP